MASVYTTSRGKNKKHKAKDQGKDHSNNMGMKLNQDLAKLTKAMTSEPKPLERIFGNRIASSSSGAKLERERLMRAFAERSCCGPACPYAHKAPGSERTLESASVDSDATVQVPSPAVLPPMVLHKCTCGLVSYCGSNCQRAHWEEHKDTCKAKRKEQAEAAAASAAGGSA